MSKEPIQELHDAALYLLGARIKLHNTMLKSKVLMSNLKELGEKMDKEFTKNVQKACRQREINKRDLEELKESIDDIHKHKRRREEWH
jgi:hypothetical protein